jgi:hypothetical protein
MSPYLYRPTDAREARPAAPAWWPPLSHTQKAHRVSLLALNPAPVIRLRYAR